MILKNRKQGKCRYMMFAFLITGIIFTACDKKSVYRGEPGNSGEEPNTFSFSTEKEVEINIHYNLPFGYRIQFEAYYSNPLSMNESKDYIKNPALKPFLVAYTDEEGNFSFKMKMPAFTEDIYVYTQASSVPTLMQGKVEGSVVRISDENQAHISKLNTRTSTKSYKDWKTQSYRLKEPVLESAYKNLTEDLLKTIDATLPKNEQLVSSYLLNHITLSEDAEVTLYFISNGESGRQNTLAYYTCPDEQPIRQEEVNQNLTLAFRNLKSQTPGEGVKLVYYKDDQPTTIFPAGTKIVFALLVDAYQEQTLQNPVHILYSELSLNAYTVLYPGGATLIRETPHMGAFMANDNFILSFEDQPYHEGLLPGDFRDEVFILSANPAVALPDVKPGNEPDKEPEYNGQTTYSGILSFEDNWPKKGDYDMNDIVISYSQTLNWRADDYRVVSIDEEYTFLHDGAHFSNGFGYQLAAGIRKNDAEVTVTSEYKCNGQGLDPDLEPATVMLFDNGAKLPSQTSFKVHTKLKKFAEFGDFNLKPFNPFIVVNQYSVTAGDYLKEKRIEVHLPQYTPTEKADPDLFSTQDDKSSNGKYYVRSGNYPFAIHLTIPYSSTLPNFTIPTENQPIDVTYPRFKSWVESNGATDSDWYVKQ